MAIRWLSAFGPEFAAENMLDNAATTPAAEWTLETTTQTTAALSPSDAHAWVALQAPSTSGTVQICPAEAFTPSTYVWLVIRDFVLDGTFATSDNRGLLQIDTGFETITIGPFFDSATAWHWRIVASGGSGGTFNMTTQFGKDEIATPLRLQFDGTDIKGWHEGSSSPEIDSALTLQPDNKKMRLASGGWGSDEECYISGVYLGDSDDEDDRPGYAAKSYYMPYDTTGSERTTEYSDENIACSDTDGLMGDVELDGSREEDNSLIIAECGGDAGIFMAPTTAPGTLTGGGFGFMLRMLGKGSTDSKTVTVLGRIEDSEGTPNSSEDGFANLALDTIHGRCSYFSLDANGDAWTQARFDDLYMGVHSDSGNGANDNWTAIIGVAYSIDNDPPGRVVPLVNNQPLRSLVQGRVA